MCNSEQNITKREANSLAKAYAETRNSWKIEEKAELLERSWKDENFLNCILKMQTLVGCDKNKQFYFGKDITDIEFTKEVVKALLRFEPQADFTSFIFLRINGEILDLNKKAEKNGSTISLNQPLNNAEGTQIELQDVIADPHIIEILPEGLRLWGAFGRYLNDLRDGKEKVSGTISRFPVYATRDYILAICPYAFLRQIQWVDAEIMIDSPYICFLRDENIHNITEATIEASKESNDLTATDVYNLYSNNQLPEERYNNQNTLNVYFIRTNLNSDYNKYINIRIAFMNENVNSY